MSGRADSSQSPSQSQRLLVRPVVEDKQQVIQLAWEKFGLKIDKEDESSIRELASYDDRNFFLQGFLGTRNNDGISLKKKPFLLKIMHSNETYNSDLLDAIDLAMIHVNNQNCGFSCSKPLPSLSGHLRVLEYFPVPREHHQRQSFITTYLENEGHMMDTFIKVESFDEKSFSDSQSPRLFMEHFVRLLSFLPGKTLTAGDLTNDLLYKVGQFTAKVRMSLKDFHHPYLESREYVWDLKNLTRLRGKYVNSLNNETEKKDLINNVIDAFEARLMPILSQLPMETIHGDLNEQNIIIENKKNGKEITGLIDFGDMNYSCRVFDLAICMAYISLLKYEDPVTSAGIVFAGYMSECDLADQEIDVLHICLIGRLAQSLVIGHYQSSIIDPDNKYLLITAEQGWKLLQKLWSFPENEIKKIWKDCCQ